MRKPSLSAILLFFLVTPFIMTYRLSSGTTPYLLFGLIFALMLGYLGLGLLSGPVIEKNRWLDLTTWLVIVLVIGGATWAAILVRHRTAPGYQIHDIILQQESAIRFLLAGRNPYATDYFGTPLEGWHYSETQTNPALYHFVMMPWYLWFSLPFYFFSISFFGFFDGRMPLVFLFFFSLWLFWRMQKGKGESRRLAVFLLAFNPATLGYFLEGRSDFFVFAFLLWGWFWLSQKKYQRAGLPLGLAFATKQSCWPLFPFYLLFLWCWGKGLKALVRNLLPFALTFALVVSPIFFQDPQAFWASTVLYLSGKTTHSYPISGYGWGMALHQLGAIRDLQAYYPFWIWQLLVCLPLFFVLWRWLKKSPQVWRLITCYGIFTLVFWYFSRYFNNSHLSYLSLVYLSAYVFGQSEKKK